jgi:hypothetical protein
LAEGGLGSAIGSRYAWSGATIQTRPLCLRRCFPQLDGYLEAPSLGFPSHKLHFSTGRPGLRYLSDNRASGPDLASLLAMI